MASRSRLAELALIGVTMVWGATFTLVKEALTDASTVVFLALRFSIAAVLLAVIFRRSLFGGQRRSTWRGGMFAGCFLAAAYYLQMSGLRTTTPTNSAFLTALCVVMVPLLGIIVYQCVPRWMEGIGVAMALLGTGLLTSPFEGAGFSRGDLLTVGCALAFACHIMVMAAYAPRSDLAGLAVIQLSTVALLGLAGFWWVEPVTLRWSFRLMAALGVTSILCTALAFTVQTWAQQHTTATRAALIFSLEPVSASVTSYLTDGQVLNGGALAGAAMILAGVLVVEWKPSTPVRHP